MALTVSLIAIIAAIVIGWKFKCNSGVIAMGAAFLIGTLMLGLRVSTIINYWPNTIVFFLISIGLFFTYANENGTMALLGKKMLFAMHGQAKLIPLVILVVGTVVSALGAGPSTPIFIGPIVFAMAAAAGISPLLVAIVITCAVYLGAGNPFNGYGGVISLSILEQNGVDGAFGIQMRTWLADSVARIIMCIIAYFVLKGYKAKNVVVEKPEDFNPVQKKTIILIIIACCLMVIPTILSTFVRNPITMLLRQVCQPQVIMVLAAIAAMAMKLGDEKKILQKINFPTIITIAGINMLMLVATEAGLVDRMAEILGRVGTPFIIVPAFSIFAAFLSFFSSGLGVVCPLLYPLAISVAKVTGIDVSTLIIVIFVGAMSSAISPFSSGGAVMVASTAEDQQDKMTRQLLPTAILMSLFGALLSAVRFFDIF